MLGAGGVGEVYRGRDPRLGRDVAIKILPSNASSDPRQLQWFEQEARAAAALNHPNILAVYDVGVHDGAPYIVSELLQGQTLRAWLSDGPIPVRTALDYATQIAQGLAAAHERGIVHRDLKPDNVFVTSDGHVKISGFGLASLIEQELSGPISPAANSSPRRTLGPVLGTLVYISPEQVRGDVVDLRTDVYALGVVLFEMLTGRSILALDHVYALKSPSLEQLLRRCLDADPARRFQTTQDLALALGSIDVTSAATTTAAVSTPVSVSAVPEKQRSNVPIAAIVFVALVLGAIVALANGC
jgi:eukaryotic-like serine/threonine-protein kinase